MEDILKKIEKLALEHDKLPIEVIKEKNIKPGLRNLNGTGVAAGLTSKGQVMGFERIKKDDGSFEINPVLGKLLYCGYEISDIARNLQEENRFGFEEVVYLLLTGELPKKADLKSFEEELRKRTSLPQRIKNIISQKSAHDDVMCALQTSVSALHLLDNNPNSLDIKDITRQCVDLIAKFPAIVCYIYSILNNKGFVEPDNELTLAQNFLYMLKGKKPADYEAKLFDLLMVFYAEHGGGNNSTFTVRTVSSTHANTYMAISSGISSLSGPLHGGANEIVYEMIENIKKNVKPWDDEAKLQDYITKILDKKAWNKSGKIYGIGHAVYTLSDPRSKFFVAEGEKLAKKTGREAEFQLYKDVARIAEKLVFEKKGKVVSANVDYYAAFIMDALGIPKQLFTPIFAMSRVAGWSAHRIEEIIQGKLIRPSYLPSIPQKEYIQIDKR